MFARDLEADLRAVEPYRAQLLARNPPPSHLARDSSPALAEYMVDRSGNGRNGLGGCACRRRRGKAVGKLFGNESGRQFAGLPARMLHERRKKRNVVADAVNIEGVER